MLAFPNNRHKTPQSRFRAGFSVVEMMIVVSIVATLAGLLYLGVNHGIMLGRQATSMKNLRQLATANLAYSAANEGYYCPAQNRNNSKRWHGGRVGNKFDPKRGYLAEFLGSEGELLVCPQFKAERDFTRDSSFEINSGGYGYNAAYIGGQPCSPFQPEQTVNVPHPQRTVMFTTSALARSAGLQEYPYSEPFYAPGPGRGGPALQPSTHFRFGGRALVAWCAGNVTAEKLSQTTSTNFYGGDNEAANCGWFGPSAENGYWNPHSRIAAMQDVGNWRLQTIQGVRSGDAIENIETIQPAYSIDEIQHVVGTLAESGTDMRRDAENPNLNPGAELGSSLGGARVAALEAEKGEQEALQALENDEERLRHH